jgi:LPXTG-motif cell wall-anchored protein
MLPSSSVPTSPTTAPPTTKPADPKGHLARTGTDSTGWLLATGGALLALGASLAAWAHRRRFSA